MCYYAILSDVHIICYAFTHVCHVASARFSISRFHNMMHVCADSFDSVCMCVCVCVCFLLCIVTFIIWRKGSGSRNRNETEREFDGDKIRPQEEKLAGLTHCRSIEKITHSFSFVLEEHETRTQ